MCFAPQRRTLFRHLNFKKCLETASFNTFDFEMCFAAFSRSQLPKVFRATTACNFSSLISPNGSARAALADFSEPTFWLSGVPTYWKSTRLRDYSTFACAWTFILLSLSPTFSRFLFSDLFSSSLFSSLILPTSAFQSVHIVGSLTSKFLSVINDQFRDLN